MEPLSIVTQIFLWALGLTFTGIFLSIGFSIGKWLCDKVRQLFRVKRAMKDNIVNEFIKSHMDISSAK